MLQRIFEGLLDCVMMLLLVVLAALGTLVVGF
jgi:hypothetical protein